MNFWCLFFLDSKWGQLIGTAQSTDFGLMGSALSWCSPATGSAGVFGRGHPQASHVVPYFRGSVRQEHTAREAKDTCFQTARGLKDSGLGNSPVGGGRY